ncbi:hypothetical protein CLV46_2047 [Diaminobutyricimonas aerilata]|uniref:Uncharacterized protein n=1 Tax=Diaminobutyricimonas aerilata TaxID=1162967 RepID=A0A2M9CKP4_9MICO|nr:DUF6264 family protein [Diaminobutyricimonas aerilata]PJJ72475.1 hypothetical protein CLV46_2047 [Diaminobutyricimonas aerilata]
MSDDRPPVPRYGEYADPETMRAATGAPVPPAHATPVAPVTPARAPRTTDVVITSVLLTLGLLVTLFTLVSLPALPQSMHQVAEVYGVEDYEAGPGVGAVQWVVGVSHVVLFLAAVAIAVPLLARRRLAFWVPLSAGIIAALIYWGAHMALFFSDERLLDALTRV